MKIILFVFALLSTCSDVDAVPGKIGTERWSEKTCRRVSKSLCDFLRLRHGEKADPNNQSIYTDPNFVDFVKVLKKRGTSFEYHSNSTYTVDGTSHKFLLGKVEGMNFSEKSFALFFDIVNNHKKGFLPIIVDPLASDTYYVVLPTLLNKRYMPLERYIYEKAPFIEPDILAQFNELIKEASVSAQPRVGTSYAFYVDTRNNQVLMCPFYYMMSNKGFKGSAFSIKSGIGPFVVNGKKYNLGDIFKYETASTRNGPIKDGSKFVFEVQRRISKKPLILSVAINSSIEQEELRNHVDILREVDASRVHAFIDTNSMTVMLQSKIDGSRLDNLVQFAGLHKGETIKDEHKQEFRKISKELIKLVAELHGKGIYHGDLKPEHIIFDGRNFHMIDFGSARRANNLSSKIGNTPKKVVFGTDGFIPPEMIAGQQIKSPFVQGIAQDIYALGYSLQLMLLGESFTIESIKEEFPYAHELVSKLMEPDPLKRLVNFMEFSSVSLLN